MLCKVSHYCDFFFSYSDEMKNKENAVLQRKKTIMSICGGWHGGSFPTRENSSVQKHRVGVPAFDLPLPVWASFTDGTYHQD